MLGGNHHRQYFWNPIIDNLKAKLEGWKSLSLSKGGRITLAQSVLNSKLLYQFSLLKVRKAVIKTMEKLIRDFIWNGGVNKSGRNIVK